MEDTHLCRNRKGLARSVALGFGRCGEWSVHQDGFFVVADGGEYRFIFVHEFLVRNAETIREAVLPKHVLRDSPGRFGECRSITLTKPIIDAGSDESLRDSA